MATFEDVIYETTKNRRICLLPIKWNALWEVLPNKERNTTGWEPSLPLILSAWDSTSVAKQSRMREHIVWAEQHGCLDMVFDFLNSLTEDDWYHGP